MSAQLRQEEIIRILSHADAPVTGLCLAERLGVTRQVIVRDIAIIKAQGADIISTARGYRLAERFIASRIVNVSHGAEEIERELCIIVDLGGRAVNTYVDHPIYGRVGESLNVKSRRDIKFFMEKTSETGCMPLLGLTNGRHSHMIEADDERTLDEIVNELKKAGFVVE